MAMKSGNRKIGIFLASNKKLDIGIAKAKENLRTRLAGDCRCVQLAYRKETRINSKFCRKLEKQGKNK